ncbi:MAG: dephospho-CoA kinase [Chitinophagaceae bacterium]|nr:dephospho-CoA kinase [Chitinophagaceae bacterium]
MLKVGITGGIGSGKTTVCRIFEMLGIPVFYADTVSRNLVQQNPEVIAAIKASFGNGIYQDALLNTKALAKIVFNDPEKLRKLNSIVHPSVFRMFNEWIAKHAGYAYVLKEAALIFETNAHLTLDAVIVVTAPESMRIKRVMQRDGATEADVQQRMKQQMPEAEKRKQATFIIHNDESELLIPQILAIHKKLLLLHPK